MAHLLTDAKQADGAAFRAFIVTHANALPFPFGRNPSNLPFQGREALDRFGTNAI
jgi:hypothetical protein